MSKESLIDGMWLPASKMASNDPHFSVQCSPTHNELVLLLGDQHNMTAVTVCDF